MPEIRSLTAARICGLSLAVVLAEPLPAQRANDLRLSPASATTAPAYFAADTTLLPARRPVNVGDGILGGVAGGVLGSLLGVGIGAAAVRDDCTGDLCGLPEAALGLVIGESIGLALGAHYASKGRANPVALTFASLGVGLAGTVLGAYAGGWPILLVPVAQLATVLSLEHP